MATPRLEVRDVLGERIVSMDRCRSPSAGAKPTTCGSAAAKSRASTRRSRSKSGKYVLRDKASRYGTFVNGEPASECELRPGDRIRLGRGGGADLLFLAGDDERQPDRESTTGARDDLRQITVLLEGFRALGSGRVLQEVLELVLDAAIEISGAERAFIMLAGADGQLEFKLARGAAKQTLTDSTFKISRKIPEEVFRVGRTRVVADLLDGGTRGRAHGHASRSASATSSACR